MTAAHIELDDAMSDDQITRLLLPLVQRLAAQIARRLPSHVRREDLASAGMVGLMQAIGRIDRTRLHQFVGYATTRIRGAILDELRRADILTQEARAMSRNIEQTISQLQMQIGRQPESNEIAEALGLSQEQYDKQLESVSHVRVVALSPRDEAEHADPSTYDDRHQETLREQTAQLSEAISGLPDREKLVLSLYYEQDLTLKEIGTILHITAARVCQLHAQALHRVKAHCHEFHGSVPEAVIRPARVAKGQRHG